LLLAMGLTEFSMHPSQLLMVKQEILRAHLPSLAQPASDVLSAFEPEQIQEALQRLAAAEFKPVKAAC
jgi:phosphoenolpyruvate-protein phosphotransferase (PTS system enzyme I)